MTIVRLLVGLAVLTGTLMVPARAQAPAADTNGLLIHLPLDGDWREMARRTLVGEPHGAYVAFTPGVAAQALVLGGPQSWVDLASDAPLLTDEGVTLELWARGDEKTPPYASTVIVAMGPFDIATQRLALGRNAVVARVATIRGPVEITGNAPLSALRWTHLALVYDGRTRETSLYVNGKLAGHVEGVVPLPSWHRDTLTLGSPREANGLQGAIDEVRVYDHARPAAAIAKDAIRASQLASLAPAPSPDTIPYRLEFDLGAEGFQNVRSIIASSIVALGFVILLAVHASGRVRMRGIIPLAAFVASLFILLGFLPAERRAHARFQTMRDALGAGRFTLVEGRVEEFRPPDRRGNALVPESFAVYSHERTFRYRYIESELTPGFRQPSDRGGPIRYMLRVRIADVDGRIARLEIAPEPGIGR
jgi:hypothetical protein